MSLCVVLLRRNKKSYWIKLDVNKCVPTKEEPLTGWLAGGKIASERRRSASYVFRSLCLPGILSYNLWHLYSVRAATAPGVYNWQTSQSAAAAAGRWWWRPNEVFQCQLARKKEGKKKHFLPVPNSSLIFFPATQKSFWLNSPIGLAAAAAAAVLVQLIHVRVCERVCASKLATPILEWSTYSSLAIAPSVQLLPESSACG